MLIIPPSLKDINSLLEIEEDLFDKNSFALSRQNFYYHIKNSYILIAKDKDIVMGYILVLIRKNSNKARIYSLAVSRHFQGKGISKILLEKAFLFAKEQEKDCIKLEVNTSNTKAINLYNRYGFVIKDTIKGYYLDKSDAYIMVKKI